MPALEFDEEFEDEVLATCLVNADYMRQAIRVLEAHHFCDENHTWVWTAIHDTWTKFAEIPTAKIFLVKAKREVADEARRKAILALVVKLLKMKPKAPKTAMEELNQFVRFVTLSDVMEKSAGALSKGNVDDAWDLCRVATRIDLRPKAYEMASWIEEFDERQEERKFKAEHPESFTCVPTGWPSLDKVALGVSAGEMALLLATTNKGKSMAAVNFGYHSVTRGFKTVHVTTEMKVGPVAQRYDSRWTGQPYIDFKKYDFTTSQLKEIEEKQKRTRKKLSGLLQIIHLPVGATTAQLSMAMEEARDLMGGLDLLVLDSPDHMAPQSRHKDHRLNQAQVFWDLKTILDEENVAGWATVQAGKEWENKMVKSEGTSESYDKARIADMIVSLNFPENRSRSTAVVDDDEDKDDKEDEAPSDSPDLVAYLAKYRDGKARISIPLKTDFERIYMGELIKEVS